MTFPLCFDNRYADVRPDTPAPTTTMFGILAAKISNWVYDATMLSKATIGAGHSNF